MEPNGAERRSDQNDGLPHWREGRREPEASHGNPLDLKDLPAPKAPKAWHWLGLFTFVLLSLSMLATVIVVTTARDKKTSHLQAEAKRLQESVRGRVKILETWLEGQHAASRRLTDSHVFRLFVTDLALQERLALLPRSLLDQRPYFRQLMTDFVRQNNLVRAAVLRADGTSLLSSPGPALPVGDLLQRLEHAPAGWTMVLTAIRHVNDEDGPLVVDAMVAIPKAQVERVETSDPAAILVLTLPVEEILDEILSNPAADSESERIALLQPQGEATETLRKGRNRIQLESNQPPDGIRPGLAATFGRRNEGHDVYALGEPVEGVAWTLYHSLDARAALSPVHDFVKTATFLAVLAVMTLAAAFAALWWRQGRNHHRRLVDLYKAQTDRLEQQRQFLESITKSIGDWLSVSGPNGELIYANPAFEAVIGKTEHLTTGRTWDELIKEMPIDGDVEHDLVSLTDADRIDVVEIDAKRYFVSPTVSDLKAEDGRVKGTVRVVRDHTKLAWERRRRLKAMAQTVDAFVHAIELRDPFLVGHTDHVRTHAIAIGRRLDLPHDDLAGLALAASLSQIGKIFIPDEILVKPGRHNDEEADVMRHHILHATDILQKVDFDMPIVKIVAQMHERLNGSGYPHGLVGDEIGLGGRILGVADVFCARTAPRSYRDRTSAGTTLYHLASNEGRYDQNVVAALADVVDDGPETLGLGTIERTFVDTGIWQEKRRQRAQVKESA